MKVLHFLLSIYLLVLSMAPCSDAVECTEANLTIVSSSIGHDNHSHEAEMCTPFCICACCGSIVPMTQQRASLSPLDFNSLEITGTYNSILPLEVYHSIWQPPKIG